MFNVLLEFVLDALEEIKDPDAMDIDEVDGGSTKVYVIPYHAYAHAF